MSLFNFYFLFEGDRNALCVCQCGGLGSRACDFSKALKGLLSFYSNLLTSPKHCVCKCANTRNDQNMNSLLIGDHSSPFRLPEAHERRKRCSLSLSSGHMLALQVY